MMESMIVNPVPTRAEVSDVANAVLDGTDAVMLSAETAAGRFPVETVEHMAAICVAAEGADTVTLEADFVNKKFGRIDQSIAMGALFTAHHLGCKAILALTESGSTALWMSRHRLATPIFGMTSQANTERKMALYRNVTPILMPQFKDRDAALTQAESQLVERGTLRPGDTYAITCGEPMGHPGGTNMLKVCQVAHEQRKVEQARRGVCTGTARMMSASDGVDITARAKAAVIVAAVLLVFVVVATTQMTIKRHACIDACRDRGFVDARYTPAVRNQPARCHCLTADESRLRTRVPAGVEISLPAR
jgi:Pyruvate kinase, alpha/beta domain/Pyruvate kinase, barrel domain